MAGVKNPNSDSTLDRRPMARGDEQGVTINEIESKVGELQPDWPEATRRRASLLFAILKEGCSIQKLEWFTKWDREYLLCQLEALRSRGLLYTGNISIQYILREVPGSEDLIERITGQKAVTQPITHRAPAGYDWEKNLQAPPVAPPVVHSNRKEEQMNIAINAGAEAGGGQVGVETCRKSEACGKPDGHTGRCAGQGGSVIGRSKKAKAPTEKASKPKPARKGRRLQPVTATTATAADVGHYKIEYEDGTRQFNFEGLGREAFLADLEAARMSANGGSNG
jgi:hypothetical protein